MEHLPAIFDPAYPLPKILCACSPDDYDEQGMIDFPERMGWEIDRHTGPVRVDETKSSIRSPVALLQAWLFFGILLDVFSIGQTKIDIHAYRQYLAGQYVLSTAALKDSLTRLERAAWQLAPDAYPQRQKLVFDCFKPLVDFLDRHWTTWVVEKCWKMTSILSLDDIMVFIILGETLQNAIIQIWPVSSEDSLMYRYRIPGNEKSFKDQFHLSHRGRLERHYSAPSHSLAL